MTKATWDQVQNEVADAISQSQEPFAPATVENVNDLVRACRKEFAAPKGATKGYWSTICLSWSDLEIEVCEDRYELYRFHDRHTDIEYFEHTPGDEVPSELLAHLPCRKIEE